MPFLWSVMMEEAGEEERVQPGSSESMFELEWKIQLEAKVEGVSRARMYEAVKEFLHEPPSGDGRGFWVSALARAPSAPFLFPRLR